LEVAGAELVGGTDLGSGHGKQMKRGHDGRPESEWWVGPAPASGAGRVRPASRAARASGVCPTNGGQHGRG
jgi:hypothetical protein